MNDDEIDKELEKRLFSMERYAEEEAELQRACHIQGDCIVLMRSENHPYTIELSQLDSHAKILSWVAHLCSKGWVTTTILSRFISLACGHHGLPEQVD
jgi:hypothetical protein